MKLIELNYQHWPTSLLLRSLKVSGTNLGKWRFALVAKLPQQKNTITLPFTWTIWSQIIKTQVATLSGTKGDGLQLALRL